MEDNIGDMMEDIRSVVSNHLSDQKYEWKETFDVLNTLPLVIDLRAQICKLEDENKKLKILFSATNEKKNIELEILEVKKEKSLEDSENPTHFFDFPTESGEDTDDEDDDEDKHTPIEFGEAHDTDDENEEEEEEDELIGGILPSSDSQDEPHVLTVFDAPPSDGIEVEVWGREEGDYEQDVRKLSDSETDVETYGVNPLNLTTDCSYFVIKHGGQTYYTRDRINGDIVCGVGDRVGEVVGKLQNGTGFFS